MPADPFYASNEWRELRRAVLRANPVCAVPGCGGRATHVDHIRSRRAGGAALDPSNLQALCHSCHSRKTARRDGGFGAWTSDAPLVAVGCDARGRPNDLTHPWHVARRVAQ
jgi:5-methylcytosine-specific restriction endonuclease McrA